MRQLHDLRATVARRSWKRREAVDGNKCPQFNREYIVRVSRECRTNVVKHSPMIRATIVRHSCDCRKYVLITLSVWPQCDYGCNVVFLSPKRVSNLSRNSRKLLASQWDTSLRSKSYLIYHHSACSAEGPNCLPDVPPFSEVCVHHRSLYSLLATENHANPAFLT